MEFQFHRDVDIPKLSWYLSIKKNNPMVHCIHGAWVESQTHFFVEGGWAETYAAARFDDSSTLMGSGGLLKENGLTLCTPCHTMECLYSMQHEDIMSFSNSLSFLLACNGDNLDPTYLNYEKDILSIAKGIDDYKHFIPTQLGRNVQLHYYCNIHINLQLDISIVMKPDVPGFKNFNAYYKFLTDSTQGIANNLADLKRKKRFEPIVFCSKGYDSSACAVIGKAIQCNEAVVYESKKALRSDSGKNIVQKLGYSIIHEKKEMDYLHYDIAEDFVSSGELGTAIFYGAAQNELSGKYLLAGDYGDLVWDRNPTSLSPNFARAGGLNLSTAMKEFRLRVGFIKVVIPFMGANRIADINKISTSSEMAPWRLNDDYDKPIPRRILEEAGISRGTFAIRKDGGVGNSLRLLGLKHLQAVMPSGSYKDFLSYFYTHKRYRRVSPVIIWRSFGYLTYLSSLYLNNLLIRKNITVIDVNKIFRKVFSLEARLSMACSPWAPSLLFNWGVSKVMRRYKKAVEEFGGRFQAPI